MKRFRLLLIALATLLAALSLLMNYWAPSEASSYHHQHVHSAHSSPEGVELNSPEKELSMTSPPPQPTVKPLKPHDAMAGEAENGKAEVEKALQPKKVSMPQAMKEIFLPAMVELAVKYEKYDTSVTLPPKVISGVKKLVLFLCWGRSGSSILGSILDAHEHIVVTNEFYIPSRVENFDKANLFNRLYYHSIHDPIRGDNWKGYNLKVKGLSNGNYSDFIEVIGDKGDETMIMSYVHDKESFKENYQNVKKSLSIPICFLRSIRNPFDIIATTTLIEEFGVRKFRTLKELNSNNQTAEAKKIDTGILSRNTARVFDLLDAAEDLIEDVIGRDNVLVMHHHDLVYDPRGTISEMFKFLEVEASEDYMDACAAKIFKSVSRSRNAIAWTPEQVEMVTARMKRFRIWDRYSFTSD